MVARWLLGDRAAAGRSKLIEKSSCRLQRAGTRTRGVLRKFGARAARRACSFGPAAAATRGRSRSMVQPHARAAAAEKLRHRRSGSCGYNDLFRHIITGTRAVPANA